MAYSKIKICNMALAALGADSIRSFSESNKRSKQCEVFYELVREYLLFKFDWGFARGFKKLQRLEDVDTPVGTYAYALPADCKIVRDLYPRGSKQWWDILNNAFICRITESVQIYYTRKEESPARFSDAFAYLAALLLAVKLAPSITRSSSTTKALYEQYLREEADAWESDASQGNDYRPADEDPNRDTFVFPDYDIVTTIHTP
jgi:hypothetical protein